MKNEKYAVILLYSTSYALKTESVLKKAGISCKLIPVPRHLSSDCGVCVRICESDIEIVKNILQSKNVEIDQISTLEKNR